MGRLQAGRRRHRVGDPRVRAGPRQPGGPDRGRGQQPARTAGARPPRRRPRRPGRVERPSVLRRGARRLHLGSRRGRHEGHGRDGPGAGARLGHHRCPAAARHRPGLRRGRGGRRQARGRFLVDEHPDLFEGCTEAISEVGGFSITVRDDLRLYLVQTAEKGLAWMRLTSGGKPGHGSFVHDDNAVTRLCEAVARLGSHRLPTVLTPPMRQFLDAVSDAYGIEIDPDSPEEALTRLGSISRMIGAALRNTVNPTMLDAGYKANVIPGTASATVDGRFLYGQEEEFERQLAGLIGEGIRREWLVHDQAVETTFDGPLVDQMVAALKAEDDGARPVPFTMSGGTDAKSFERLGMRCFGFSPLRLPPDLDFASLFHGIDERVPVESLRFGVRVLDRFLRSA